MSMYTVDSTKSEGSSYSPMPVTIEAGRFITDIKFVKSDVGTNYLHIEMTDKQGRKVSGNYYEPLREKSKDDESFKRNVDSIVSLFANLGRKFQGENFTMSGDNFEQACNNLIKSLGSDYQLKELRTKVVLNDKNYVTLPRFAPIWEDPQVVSEADSKLFYRANDRVKPVVATPDKDTVFATPEETPANSINEWMK